MTQHTDLIALLRANADMMPTDSHIGRQYKSAADALEAQAREIEGLRKDAERYRLLRECGVDSYEACGSGDKLDAECDAAIAKKGQP